MLPDVIDTVSVLYSGAAYGTEGWEGLGLGGGRQGGKTHYR